MPTPWRSSKVPTLVVHSGAPVPETSTVAGSCLAAAEVPFGETLQLFVWHAGPIIHDAQGKARGLTFQGNRHMPPLVVVTNRVEDYIPDCLFHH